MLNDTTNACLSQSSIIHRASISLDRAHLSMCVPLSLYWFVYLTVLRKLTFCVPTASRSHVDEVALAKASHLHVAGYYNCSGLQAPLPEILKKAKEAGLTISLDPQEDAEGKWSRE